jgi:antitoxin (DNA-binding transcriptional repressor) of toxin-antitoxin stability system
VVERGEEVAITRRGKAVARLVQARSGVDRETARGAAQRIWDMSKGVTLGRLLINSPIDEGRQ